MPQNQAFSSICHYCGKLVCDQCNTAVGLFHEDIERIKSAITYLEGYQNVPR